MELLSEIRARTLCRMGRHCSPDRVIQKYDNGRLPLLCCYCRKIIGWGRKRIG